MADSIPYPITLQLRTKPEFQKHLSACESPRHRPSHGAKFVFGLSNKESLFTGCKPTLRFTEGCPGSKQAELIGSVDKLHRSLSDRASSRTTTLIRRFHK